VRVCLGIVGIYGPVRSPKAAKSDRKLSYKRTTCHAALTQRGVVSVDYYCSCLQGDPSRETISPEQKTWRVADDAGF